METYLANADGGCKTEFCNLIVGCNWSGWACGVNRTYPDGADWTTAKTVNINNFNISKLEKKNFKKKWLKLLVKRPVFNYIFYIHFKLTTLIKHEDQENRV